MADVVETTEQQEGSEPKISYSRMETYEKCPFKYKLKYVDGHYIKSNTIATEFGTLMHETEESIANSIIAGTTIDYTQLRNNFYVTCETLKLKYSKDYYELDKTDRNYDQKKLAYMDKNIYKLEEFMKAHPSYSIVGVEKDFEFDFNSKVLNESGTNNVYKFYGFIDRIFYDKEKDLYIIQDIKSWPTSKGHDVSAPLQFAVYTLAALKLYNITIDKVKCQYYLPIDDITLDVTSSVTELINKGTEELNTMFQSIVNEDFHPKYSALCAWCEFSPTNPDQPEDAKNLCPYHAIWDRVTRAKGSHKIPACTWLGLKNHDQVLREYIAKGGGAKWQK